jgi:hypothetical protein
MITCLSANAKYDKKDKTYTVTNKDKHVIMNIEGEFTDYLRFHGENFWKLSDYTFPSFKRMSNTLPSDSTFREDLNWLKKGDEDMAQKFKVKLEEIQRNDRKLRENNKKK